MRALNLISAILLIVGGVIFIVLVGTFAIMVIQIDIILNVMISVGIVLSIKSYIDDKRKLAVVACILLLATEAAWILLPILLAVPFALILLLISLATSQQTTGLKVAGILLGAVGLIFTGLFIAAFFSAYFNVGLGIFQDLSQGGNFFFISWGLFFIGRDVIPGILIALSSSTSSTIEPSYKTYISATSNT
jgi:hypothetical protein